MKTTSNNDVAVNRKALFEYEIVEQIEAGLVLLGEEIKAIRERKVDLQGSYGRIMGTIKPELFWVNGYIDSSDPHRTRKLLVHTKELLQLIQKTQTKGLTLIPLSLYLKNGRAKLNIAVVKGKKTHDKRAIIKKRDLDREARRQIN